MDHRMMDHEQASDDYDSPWKGLVEQYFPDFLAWRRR